MRIKIATLNFWGLPWPFSVDKKKRLEMLVLFIKRNKLDIICLQEIWLNRDFKYLCFKLSEYYSFKPKNFIFNSSGLVIFSKFKLSDSEFYPFNFLFKNFELSRKGFILLKVKIKNKIFKIINTHLYHHQNIFGEKTREKQINLIRKNLDNSPTFILGDFNTINNNWSINKFKIISKKDEPTFSLKNKYVHRGIMKFFNNSDLYCDLILSNSKFRVIKKKIYKTEISDHYFISSEIEL